MHAGGDGFSELEVDVLRVAAFHERWQCLGEEGLLAGPRPSGSAVGGAPNSAGDAAWRLEGVRRQCCAHRGD